MKEITSTALGREVGRIKAGAQPAETLSQRMAEQMHLLVAMTRDAEQRRMNSILLTKKE